MVEAESQGPVGIATDGHNWQRRRRSGLYVGGMAGSELRPVPVSEPEVSNLQDRVGFAVCLAAVGGGQLVILGPFDDLPRDRCTSLD